MDNTTVAPMRDVPPALPPSQVDAQLENLANATSEIIERLNTLVSRLSPVLRDECDEEICQQPQEYLVTVADRIRTNRFNIETTIHIVNQTIDRLGI